MAAIKALTSNTTSFLLSLQRAILPHFYSACKTSLFLNIFNSLTALIFIDFVPLPQLPAADSAKLAARDRIKQPVPESRNTRHKEKHIAVGVGTAPGFNFFKL